MKFDNLYPHKHCIVKLQWISHCPKRSNHIPTDNGIFKFLFPAVDVATDCSADASSKIARLTKSLDQVRTNYLSAYQKALDGIDQCAKIYPNKAQLSRLQSCVESMNNNYFSAANQMQNSVFPSPTMNYFTDTVLGCASVAADSVVSKGWTFLSLLKECASMDPTINQQSYADQLVSVSNINN